jgi:hypothetical protein
MPPDMLAIHPLTADRWADLEELFGPQRGANSGCWCMWLRVGGADYKAMDKEGRKNAFRSIVEEGLPPGLLAYDGDKAVGWCAVGPRTSFARFQSAKSSRPSTTLASQIPHGFMQLHASLFEPAIAGRD